MHAGSWHKIVSRPDEKPKMTRALLRRVLNYAKPYRRQIVFLLATILTSTGLSLLTPLILRDLIDNTIPNKDINRLIMLSVALLFIPAISGGMNIIQRRLNATIGEGVIYDLRVAVFAHLQRMSLRFFTNTRVGELLSRLNNDVVGAQNAISNTIVGMITNFLQAAAVLAVMFVLEWHLTLLAIIILPLFILASNKLADRLRDVVRKQMDANASMNALLNETLNIGGALLIKLFGRAPVEVDRFKGRAAEVRNLGVKRAVMGVTFMVIVGLLSAIGSALVYGLGGYFAILGIFTVGKIVAFGAYLGSLYVALQGLSNAPVEFATSVVSFERVFEVIDLPLDIDDRPGAIALTNIQGELEFDHVCFRYPSQQTSFLKTVERHGSVDAISAALSGDQPPHLSEKETSIHHQARESALDEISFHIQPGQLVALVGPSGAGKTTLTYLIPRLYDPISGAVRVDGHDLRDVQLNSLTDQIGMVTQETHLFHDTIRTNLVYARLDATQQEIEAAARAANIHDFIAGLPDGYETTVGERGYRLSGGEKQRIALARVILKNPRILVLDEATSHLDSESEALIQEALKRVMAGRTSVVIAHRLSTILAADLILVLDRGKIVEQGNHQELLAMNGVYAHLYQTQFNRAEQNSLS
ncbi:MAG: ABC transporter ATP-binding protein [Anaerolineaceae bacterium]